MKLLPARLSRLAQFIALLVVCTFPVVSCTSLDSDPTPTAAPTEVTFGPNDVAVGELFDRAEAAWATLDGWTSEARSEPLDASKSGAGATVTTEQVLLPSTRRVVNASASTILSEELAIDGTIYLRGTLVTSSIYFNVDPDTWISFTPEDVPPDTPLAQAVRYLIGDPAFPFATVTAETRALPARPVGDMQMNGRNCSVYQFVKDETSTGITFRVAFDDQWLPCQLVIEGGGIVETTTWDYDLGSISISAPTDAVPVDTFPTSIN